MMKVNIENCINQSITKTDGFHKYSMQEFIENLKLLKTEHEKGNSEKVLDEFFSVYVFNADQAPPATKAEHNRRMMQC